MSLFKDKKKKIELTPEQYQELLSQIGASSSLFSYGLVESLFMTDMGDRIFYIHGEIDENIFREIDSFIIKINAEDAGIEPEKRLPIKLVISSVGGSVYDGLGTINCIRNSITPIIGICTSYAFSMAFYIFISCHLRIATSDTAFLNHDGTMGIIDSTSKTEDAIEFHKRVNQRLNKILVSRSKFTTTELENTKRVEKYYFGDEGMELGFVDQLIGDDLTFGDIFGSSEATKEESKCEFMPVEVEI